MEIKTHQQKFTDINQTLSSFNLLELDNVVKQINNLRKQKLSTVLSQAETKLFRKINIVPPKEIQKRFNHLLFKRKNETLTDIEYQELLELTTYMENLKVQRLKYLIELSKIRNISLDELIKQLDFKPNLYVV